MEQGFPNKTRLPLKHSPHLGLSQRNDLKTIWSQSHDPIHSWTIPLSELHQSQVCLTRYYRLYCVGFLLYAKLILFSLARWQGPTWQFHSLQRFMLGEQLIPEFMLVFKLTKHFDIPQFYYQAWWLYPANSFVVSANKPFIHQMVGPTDVIEVFSAITDSGGALVVERQTPSGITYQTVESTFSGEVMKEQFCGVCGVRKGKTEACC